jgi:signal transduction histidine kinase
VTQVANREQLARLEPSTRNRGPHVDREMTDPIKESALVAQLRHLQKTEAITRLAGGIAHDFNNMLTVILGRCEDLSTEGSPVQLHEGLEDIKHAAEHAAGLSRQLLNFARKQPPRLRVLDLNVVVTSVEPLLVRLTGRDISLVTLLNPTLGLVKVDPSQLEQVIVNLVLNARDAMPAGGRLTIETINARVGQEQGPASGELKPGVYSVLAVHDIGCGMTDDVKAHLFEPYFTTKEIGRGTGLGLATVYDIIRDWGGHIIVSSEPGRGTTFRVYLPQVS